MTASSWRTARALVATALVGSAAACGSGSPRVALVRLFDHPTLHVASSRAEGDARSLLEAGVALPPLRHDVAADAWESREKGHGIPGVTGAVWMADLPVPATARTIHLERNDGVVAPFRGTPGDDFTWIHDGTHLALIPPAGEDAPPGACEVTYAIDPAWVRDPFHGARVPGTPDHDDREPGERPSADGGASGRYQVAGATFDAVAMELPGEAQWSLRVDANAVLRFGVVAESGGIVAAGETLRRVDAPIESLDVEVTIDGESLGRSRLGAEELREGVVPVRIALGGRLERPGTLGVAVLRTTGTSPARVFLVDPRIETADDETARRGVVLVVLDTLRRDRLGCYGAERPTSPVLDAFAAEGTRFDRATSNANWTLPAHASLFLSRLPHEHRVWTLRDRLHGAAPTLARLLRDRGHVTAAITDGGLLRASFGFDRGFGEYHDRRRGAVAVFDRAARWIEASAGAPFFLFVHTYEVHAPYGASREILHEVAPEYDGPLVQDLEHLAQVREQGEDTQDRERIARHRTLYDGGVRTTDAAIGTLLASLRRAGLEDRVLVVVTSDHGEAFGEHRLLGHGGGYFEEELAIPLLLRGPGVPAGTVRDDRVSLVDVAPSVLDWWGLPSRPEHVGRSLLRTIPAEPVIAAGFRRKTAVVEFAVLDGPWKLVRTRREIGSGRDAGLLFDLGRDPYEREDRSVDRSAVRDRLRGVFERSASADGVSNLRAARDRATLEENEELRALGYAGG